MTSPFTEPDDTIEEPSPSEPPEPTQPTLKAMMPLDRRRLRTGHPPQAIPLAPEDREDGWAEETVSNVVRSSRQDLDPVFGYILVTALSVGLIPLQPNMRYVILWTLMAAMGGLAFLIGSGIRLKVTDPGDLLWGIGLGAFTGGALLVAGADTLAVTSERLFAEGQTDNPLLDTWVFQATVFVMPLAESLFFRGAMQRVHPIPVVALLASVWSMVMFFPNLGLNDTFAVGFVIGTAIVVLNFLYSYVNFRHGLAASFFSQVIAGSLLLLVPRLISF